MRRRRGAWFLFSKEPRQLSRIAGSRRLDRQKLRHLQVSGDLCCGPGGHGPVQSDRPPGLDGAGNGDRAQPVDRGKMKLPDGNGIGKDPYQNSGMKQQRGRQMKKTLGMAVMLTVFTAFAFLSPAGADFKKTKIAVLDFQLHGDRYETADMGKIVAEWLITALVKEGRFDVIERRMLSKVLDEQKIGASGVVDARSASQLGKVLGAKVVITGSVLQFQNIVEVNARIIEVESGSIIAAESAKSTSAVALEHLVVEMAQKIIKDFPLEGYVVLRKEGSVLIDLGQQAGVRQGMKFVAYREGKVIKHPKTGEVLDVETIELGEIEIKEVSPKTASGEVAREESPGAITYGVMVRSAVQGELTPVTE